MEELKIYDNEISENKNTSIPEIGNEIDYIDLNNEGQIESDEGRNKKIKFLKWKKNSCAFDSFIAIYINSIKPNIENKFGKDVCKDKDNFIL